MTNVITLRKPGIRNETDLKRFVKHHASAAPDEMVQAINISIQLSQFASVASDRHRLNAGRLLLELRGRVEAKGEDWWKWQAGKFERGRKDMERLMRFARADNPEQAERQEREKNTAQHRAARGADVRSKVDHILHLIEALNDQEREQLRAMCEERWSWQD